MPDGRTGRHPDDLDMVPHRPAGRPRHVRCRRLTGPFPREEYEERLGRLRRVMVERRLLRCGEDTGETP